MDARGLKRLASIGVSATVFLVVLSHGPKPSTGSSVAPLAASAAERPGGPQRSPLRRGAGVWRELQRGVATYYAAFFEGRTTASGVPFDNDAMVAAHPELPFGTLVRVTNLRNGRSVQVRVVDRGPADGPQSSGVVIDLSRAAAKALGFIRAGRTRVQLYILRDEMRSDTSR